MRRAALNVAATLLAAGALAPAAKAARVLVAAHDPRSLPAGAAPVAPVADGVTAYTLRVPDGVDAVSYAARLERRPGVVAAQPDYRLRASQATSTCAPKPTQVDQSIAQQVNALQVSVPTTPPIAILDTGVDGNVPELANKVVSPFSALDGSSDANDLDSHGTEVAAVAAAAPGLLRGVSPTSPVMPIKIFTPAGDSSAEILVKGIAQAVAAKAAVINISGANPASDASAADLSVVAMAIDNAFAHGVLTVAAAGNEGSASPDVPAALPHVLSVGAVDSLNSRALFSNTGPYLDLLAPGSNLVLPVPAVACPNSGFTTSSGTSFSAPAVSAAVAIVRQLHPTYSAEQIFQVIRQTATDESLPGRDDDTGYGLLNVSAAVSRAAPKVDATELDDDVIWLTGAYASAHPGLLSTRRLQRVSGSVSPAKDPQDVYPVRLKAGERLTVRVTAKSPDDLLDAGIWDPRTGPFDISNDKTTHKVVDYLGVSAAPEISYEAKKGGRYYVSVEATDVPAPPTDPTQPAETVPDSEPYTLTVSAAKVPQRKPRRHSRKTGKG
jgi:subtilisin family serine protease